MSGIGQAQESAVGSGGRRLVKDLGPRGFYIENGLIHVHYYKGPGGQAAVLQFVYCR